MITKIRKQMKQLTAKSSDKVVLAKLLIDMSSLVAGVCVITCFILIGLVLDYRAENIRLRGQIINKNTEISEMSQTNISLINTISDLESEINNQKTEYEELAKISVDLDTQNKELVDQINSQNEELNKLEQRAELFDQYEYALIREDGTRTDITYDDINTLESLAKERGMGKDAVDLVMAIAMAESDGVEDAKNEESSATGFGGLLSNTAKYIYETELNSPEGTYNHSTMAKDGKLNLQISLCLIDYLADQNNRNPVETVYDYRGTKDKDYVSKINKYLLTKNKVLYNLTI